MPPLSHRQGPFLPCPDHAGVAWTWPTRNQALFDQPAAFFARTRVNPDYGKPGWTRDAGKRFHCGCDIAPVRATPTGDTRRVMFTDPATGEEFPSDEPAWIPDDIVMAIADGVVHESVIDETRSTFGQHVVLEHRWPDDGSRYFSIYAHVRDIVVANGEPVSAGRMLAHMGQTSASEDARRWMAIAPHVHLEIWDDQQQPYDPVALLLRFLPRPR